MKKILLLLVFSTFSSFAQQSFDLIKSLNADRMVDINSKIKLINTYGNTFEFNDSDKIIIKDLELFLKNPFDNSITNFQLSNSLERLDAIAKKVVIPQVNSMIKGGSGNIKNNEILKPLFKDTAIEALTELPSSIPSGYSASTQIINALSQFLVDRTKQELTLTFYENFKDKLEVSININLSDGSILTIKLKDLFKTTYRLFESKNYFDELGEHNTSEKSILILHL